MLIFSKVFFSETTSISNKFSRENHCMVLFQVCVFQKARCNRGWLRGKTLFHRNTVLIISNVFSSGTTGSISTKFSMHDPCMVLFQVCVFYGGRFNRGRIRGSTLFHANAVGKQIQYLFLCKYSIDFNEN